jgi:hypothetical protein
LPAGAIDFAIERQHAISLTFVLTFIMAGDLRSRRAGLVFAARAELSLLRVQPGRSDRFRRRIETGLWRADWMGADGGLVSNCAERLHRRFPNRLCRSQPPGARNRRDCHDCRRAGSAPGRGRNAGDDHVADFRDVLRNRGFGLAGERHPAPSRSCRTLERPRIISLICWRAASNSRRSDSKTANDGPRGACPQRETAASPATSLAQSRPST